MIELSELRKVYGRGDSLITALDGVSLRVEQGEIAAVVGPSGAGKSTLARCINLLERPTSGSVVVDGRDLTALGERRLRDARRAIGTIFQASSLLSRRTAADNVGLPLDFLGVGKSERNARVGELLDRVGLGNRAKAYPHELSGGQRQRVGIARALALRPSILLADEATSGLDPDTTSVVLRMLRELRDDLGLTIILITHDMEVVREVADVAALIRDGLIIERGRMTELMTNPASPLGAALLPARARASAKEGDQVWRVQYGPQADPDWIGKLAGELQVRVSLLAATVEAVGGETAGRVTIAVPSHQLETRLRALLSGWGLHAELIDNAQDGHVSRSEDTHSGEGVPFEVAANGDGSSARTIA